MESIRLLVPEQDTVDPELSLVIPALNEERTIAPFLEWCREGIAACGARTEILIVNSSTDRTASIALSMGARVLEVPARGLGRAYLDSLSYVRGRYLILGDCDCTYDFRKLGPFLERFHEGFEFIMGSRMRGTIEPGAMPPLHRYFGTPLTTWILNRIFSSRFTDIHCGMRGITREALERMRLQSQSWDYASEMVLKSVQMGMKTAEVPVSFYRDRDGRLSHHLRSGPLSPWRAGWTNLRAMLTWGADFFLLRPGAVIALLGLSLTLPLAMGPVTLGPITFSLNWMLLGVSLSILGIQSVYMGLLVRVIRDASGAQGRALARVFPYTRTVILSVALFGLGVVLASFLVAHYVASGYRLDVWPHWTSNLALLGLLCTILSFMTFTFTLVLHSTRMALGGRGSPSDLD